MRDGIDEVSKAIRRANRARTVADLRDGRKFRANRIESAHQYRRTVKHPARVEA